MKTSTQKYELVLDDTRVIEAARTELAETEASE